MPLVLSLALLASCAVDEYGVRGTPLMLQMLFIYFHESFSDHHLLYALATW